MSFLDSLASLALSLSAKVFPVEPTSAKTPEPESEEELGQPIEQVEVADQTSFVDDEEPSESDDIGQLRTDLEEALAQVDSISQDLDVLKFENKEEERDLHDEQDLGFTLSAIAAGATGMIRHAVYQEGAVVPFGDSCMAYNLGPSDAGNGVPVLLQFGDHPVPCFPMGGGGADPSWYHIALDYDIDYTTEIGEQTVLTLNLTSEPYLISANLMAAFPYYSQYCGSNNGFHAYLFQNGNPLTAFFGTSTLFPVADGGTIELKVKGAALAGLRVLANDDTGVGGKCTWLTALKVKSMV